MTGIPKEGIQKEFKELTAEDMAKANNALQAHRLIIAELKRKIEHELYMAEAAATAGWGAVAVLENKMFTKVSGANDAEKEMKSQKIRKAMETYSKEQKLHKKAGRRSSPGSGSAPASTSASDAGSSPRSSTDTPATAAV